jgi:hypothetical protein
VVVVRSASGIGIYMEKLIIDGRPVGPGELPYIVAEIGSNHNGDMDLCRKLQPSFSHGPNRR